MGYAKGMALALDDWAPLIREHPEWLETIMLYGTEEGWERLLERDLTLEQHQERVWALSGEVRKIYEYWRQ